MLFSTPGQAILVAHERCSRLTIALRQPSLKADPVAAALIGMLEGLPPTWRRSITFDNGTEFTRHQRIWLFTQVGPARTVNWPLSGITPMMALRSLRSGIGWA